MIQKPRDPDKPKTSHTDQRQSDNKSIVQINENHKEQKNKNIPRGDAGEITGGKCSVASQGEDGMNSQRHEGEQRRHTQTHTRTNEEIRNSWSEVGKGTGERKNTESRNRKARRDT